MRVSLFVGVLALFIKSSKSMSEITEKFIRKSNKTISIIAIDDEINKKVFFHPKTSLKTFIMFNIQSEMLVNCKNLEKVDKYSNESTSPIELNKFRKLQTFKNFIELQCEDCDNVIFSPSHFLDSILCFVNSFGTFLIIVTDNKTTFSDDELMDMLSKTWTVNGALKVFLSMNDNVYSFDPFHRNPNGLFGKLNSFSDPSDNQKLKNMNGYPMKVEMFSATFTYTTVKQPLRVDDFTGPDVNAALFIRDQLNATS